MILLKIDRYIVSTFVPYFFVCMFAICGIYIVVDILQNLDDFIEMGSKAFLLAGYYYAFMIPVVLAQLFPAITLISVSLVLVRFVKSNEIFAMQVAGMCMYRILLPVFVLSVLMSFAAVANQELIIPRYAKKLKSVEQSTFIDKEKSNILVEDPENNMLLRTRVFNVAEKKLVSVFAIGRNENGKKKFTISAKTGEWTEEKKWLLFDVVRHNYDENGNWIAPTIQEEEYYLETSLTPELLDKVDVNAALKSFKELQILREQEPENHMYRVMFHSRMAYPLTNFVLLFLGIPFVIGFERISRSVFLRVGICVLICSAFYVLTYICVNLGNLGILHPILAAWLPVVIFGTFGLFLFDWIRF
ncbi:MAG: LptF/LptG family permease [Candidatus Scalindua sp. AMX11]|nr:MAG: LptF/LptG family permease [Candidatus Scalindua sp.]NOG85719.1 LptF/LptG family permease [Planctomycetota bacterium]RZV73167.1 MAG: LptF/LptG family permease [Candidatus Scalindua sp. SCAELEC01]TDE64744.1 MAG: LptF/LptG family permease [Candidatus Scalindua sp. AMX11]GJQ58694.1 MAG: LPS export ABC transporter permease LptG [Candidatus Scalindua sp.]